jgi:UDP-GlcNAc:undecaprenyl-phosphate GlcNAc-1-phosphate transferase
MAVASGGVAVLSYRYGLPYTATLVGLLLAGVVVLGAKLGLQRVYPERSAATGMVRVLADFQFKKQVATVAIDAALVALAYYSAYVLRFEDTLAAELPLFTASLLIVLPCHVLMLGLFKTYQDSWRHTGLHDLLSLVGAATAGVALSVLVVLLLFRFEHYSRAVFVIHWLLVAAFLTASRVLFRALGELLRGESQRGPRTVIYGAGAGGVMVLREARANRTLDWTVIGFIDDDRAKQRTSVQGVPVLGTLEQVAPLLASGQVTQVVVSTESVPAERLDALQRLCADAGVRTLHASLQFRLDPITAD